MGASLVLASPGCGAGDGPVAAGPSVVAGTTQVADMARSVALGRARVHGVLAPNSDPHDYEPRPSDARAFAGADLVLASGGDLDPWVAELVESSGTRAEVVTLRDAVGAAGDDPHWWQDPRNAVRAVAAIRDRLRALDPPGADLYDRNAARYTRRLERLDRSVAACIGRVPRAERKLVTSHDSLGYFAERYGIEVVGSTIPALTTQSQPSAGETADLIGLIRRERVKAVFPETGVNTDVERAVARETGAAVGGDLFSDALGREGSPGATYAGALAENARRIADGLSGGKVKCELPA